MKLDRRGLGVGALFCLLFWLIAIGAMIHEYTRYSECRSVGFSAWHCFMWR